jgi:hypothetical protein
VPADGMALDTCALRNGFDSRLRRADVPMELEGRADDPLAGVAHRLSTAPHRVSPGSPRCFVYHACSINR